MQSSPDYSDVVEIKNITSETITIWWGSDIYNIPPNSVGHIPRLVAMGVKNHESYKGLVIEDEQTPAKTEERTKNSPPETKGTETSEEVLVPWSDPEWDATVCPIEDVMLYATKFNLKIIENTPGETIRAIVDEHFIASLG
jgi:hypothetical protein